MKMSNVKWKLIERNKNQINCLLVSVPNRWIVVWVSYTSVNLYFIRFNETNDDWCFLHEFQQRMKRNLNQLPTHFWKIWWNTDVNGQIQHYYHTRCHVPIPKNVLIDKKNVWANEHSKQRPPNQVNLIKCVNCNYSV